MEVEGNPLEIRVSRSKVNNMECHVWVVNVGGQAILLASMDKLKLFCGAGMGRDGRVRNGDAFRNGDLGQDGGKVFAGSCSGGAAAGPVVDCEVGGWQQQRTGGPTVPGSKCAAIIVQTRLRSRDDAVAALNVEAKRLHAIPGRHQLSYDPSRPRTGLCITVSCRKWEARGLNLPSPTSHGPVRVRAPQRRTAAQASHSHNPRSAQSSNQPPELFPTWPFPDLIGPGTLPFSMALHRDPLHHSLVPFGSGKRGTPADAATRRNFSRAHDFPVQFP
ncbi:hypothetical protein VUR80DRAFT_10277 [Thermomyces stellatus]